MTLNLFTPDSVEDTVIELDTFRNDVLGAAAFSFGLTALQFPANQAPSIATLAAVFLLLWALFRLAPKYSEHKRLYDNLGYWAGSFRVFRANGIFFLGLLFLVFVAGGALTLDRLPCFSLAKALAH